jgi:hypothetical protein
MDTSARVSDLGGCRKDGQTDRDEEPSASIVCWKLVRREGIEPSTY